MKSTCSTCKFHHTLPWELEDGTTGDNHFCRFNPPMAVSANQSALLPVAPDGWCGQWAAQSLQKVRRTIRVKVS